MSFIKHRILPVLVILLTIFFHEFSLASATKQCSACPAHKPCKITIPSGDKCNTCQYNVHCSDDNWYKDILLKCTNIDCSKLVPIDNPFEIPEEQRE